MNPPESFDSLPQPLYFITSKFASPSSILFIVMARVASTHRETVRSDFAAAERPDQVEKEEDLSSSPDEAAVDVGGDEPS